MCDHCLDGGFSGEWMGPGLWLGDILIQVMVIVVHACEMQVQELEIAGTRQLRASTDGHSGEPSSARAKPTERKACRVQSSMNCTSEIYETLSD